MRSPAAWRPTTRIRALSTAGSTPRPRVLELLDQYRPDLVFLQETKSEPDAFPELELAGAGYRAVHHSAGRWAGVALLAKKDAEISNVCAGLEGEPALD